MNSNARALGLALILFGASTLAWADFRSECAANEADAADALQFQYVYVPPFHTARPARFQLALHGDRRFCPLDSARHFVWISMSSSAIPERVNQPPAKFPKVTVIQNGKTLGWFGAEYVQDPNGEVVLVQHGSGFSWLPPDQDYFRFRSESFALKPDPGVEFDPDAAFTLKVRHIEGLDEDINVPATGAIDIPINGLWADPAEPGWGVILKRGSRGVVFANWHTYDEAGRPIWLVMPNGQPVERDIVEGDVYFPTGPALSSAAFDSTRFSAGAPVGTFRIRFENGNAATFDFNVQGHRGRKKLQPLPLRNEDGRDCAQYNEVFWNSSEAGWALAIHGGRLYLNCPMHALMTTYGPDGRPTWFFSGASFVKKVYGGVNRVLHYFEGLAYEPHGPFFGAPYTQGAFVLGDPVGSMNIVITDFGVGPVLDYTLHGFQRQVALKVFNY